MQSVKQNLTEWNRLFFFSLISVDLMTTINIGIFLIFLLLKFQEYFGILYSSHVYKQSKNSLHQHLEERFQIWLDLKP
jgi:hypothetical protein